MCKVIAVTNQKGGVGKTTTTINLGVALAKNNKRVLLIDLDAQANLTIGLGFDPDEIEHTIADLIDAKANNYNYLVDKEKFILNSEGVDIIPSDIRLSSIEIKLLNVMNRESILKNIISNLKNKYDYILIDCLPSLGTLNINALVAADSVIIPVQAQFFSLKGMEQLLQSIINVKEQINSNLHIEGLLITMYDKRTNISKEVKRALQDTYSVEINTFKTMINISTKIAEAPSEGKSIFSYQPNSEVAKNYYNLAKEVEKNE